MWDRFQGVEITAGCLHQSIRSGQATTSEARVNIHPLLSRETIKIINEIVDCIQWYVEGQINESANIETFVEVLSSTENRLMISLSSYVSWPRCVTSVLISAP